MITVAVSGINAVDNPGPGTGIARCLRESGLSVKLIGFAYDTLEPGIYMDWVFDKTYILPYPSSNSSDFIERLKYINEQENLDIIIPALDVEIPLYMKIEQELENMGLRIMVPGRKAFQERGKDRLPLLSSRIGVKSPRTAVISDLSEAADVCNGVGYPCFIKGPFYEAEKVDGTDEALKSVHELASRWGYPIVVQEKINGDEYNCAGLGDGKKEMGMVAVKKVATTKLGKAWTIVSVVNQKIFHAAHLLVETLGWRGAFELELILEKDSNEFYCIEINPRFPAWIYMAGACGINLPERMVQNLMGLSYESHSSYSAGKLMIRYTAEMIRNIEDIENVSLKAES